MNKLKIMLYFILFVALVIVVAENFKYFSTSQSLVFNLKYKSWTIPPIPTGLFVFGAFVLGYFFAYVNGLHIRFQTNKTVRTMNARMKVQLDELSSLRKEVEFLQRNPSRTPAPAKKEQEEAVPETVEGELNQAPAQG